MKKKNFKKFKNDILETLSIQTSRMSSLEDTIRNISLDAKAARNSTTTKNMMSTLYERVDLINQLLHSFVNDSAEIIYQIQEAEKNKDDIVPNLEAALESANKLNERLKDTVEIHDGIMKQINNK